MPHLSAFILRPPLAQADLLTSRSRRRRPTIDGSDTFSKVTQLARIMYNNIDLQRYSYALLAAAAAAAVAINIIIMIIVIIIITLAPVRCDVYGHWRVAVVVVRLCAYV